MERTEDDELLAAFEEGVDEVDGLRYLSVCGQRAKRHELDKCFHSHLATYLTITALLVLAKVFCQVVCGKVVFVSVADVNVEIDTCLVGKVGQNLCLLPAYHAGGVELLTEY